MAEIDSLEITVSASLQKAVSEMNKLTAALQQLNTAASSGGLSQIASNVSALNASMSSSSSSATKAASSMSKYASTIGKISSAISSVNSASTATAGVDSLKSSLQALAKSAVSIQVDGETLTGTIERIGDASEQNAELVGKLGDELGNLGDAKTLNSASMASELKQVSTQLEETGTQAETASTGVNTLAKAFNVLKGSIAFMALKKIVSVMEECVQESMDYTENLNMFAVAMGDSATSAYEYAEAVNAALGIDVSDWMRYQGTLQSIASGFGLASDAATTMSQNLTQIAYDISSFYNLDVEDAMTKIRGGISGELEGLRAVGYDLSEARLKQIAYAQGIDTSYDSMTQAEKAQLRYIAIMEQSGNVMGDMARTIDSPANAVRVLQQEFQQLARAVGNIAIPALSAIIPVVRAVVQVLTDAANAIAAFFGFTIEWPDFSSVSSTLEDSAGGASDLSDGLSGASSAAKELKATILGIDELNLMADNSDSGGSGGGSGGSAGVSGSGWDLDLPSYDFLGDANSAANELYETTKKILKEWGEIVATIAGLYTLYKVVNWLKDGYTAISKWVSGLSQVGKIALGLTLMVTGYKLEFDSAYDMYYSGPNLANVVGNVLGAALGIAGSLLVFGTGPLGWAVGIGLALTINLAAAVKAKNQKAMEEELKERFGSIELTVEEAKELAEKNIADNPLKIQIDAYVEENTKLDTLLEDYVNAHEELQHLSVKASVGFDVTKDEWSTAIEDMISAGEAYAAQQQLTMQIAVKTIFGGSEYESEVSAELTELTSKLQGELTAKGEELRDYLDEAFADGVLSDEERKVIDNLTTEYNEIMAEFNAQKFQSSANTAAGSTFAKDGFTADSVITYLEQVTTEYQDARTELESAYDTVLGGLYSSFTSGGIDEETYYEQTKEAALNYADKTVSLWQSGFGIVQSNLTSAYGDVVDNVSISLDEANNVLGERLASGSITAGQYSAMQSYYEQFMGDMSNVYAKGIVDQTTAMEAAWDAAGQKVGKATKDSIEKMLDALDANGYTSEMNAAAEQYRKYGASLPEELADGMKQYQSLQAIIGSEDAIMYMTGIEYSNSDSFYEALSVNEGMGAQFPDAIANGITDNTTVTYDALKNMYTVIKEDGHKLTLDATDALKQNFKDMGINVINAYKDGVTSNDTTSTIKSALASPFVGTALETATDKALRAGETVGKSYGTAISSVIKKLKLPTIVSRTTTQAGIAKVSFEMYADGGFPDIGELFMARESGPELVGRMGSKNAVANTQQIVDGITNGVNRANSTQNQLLREQNTLLRQILAKDSTVQAVVSTSDIVEGLARQNRRNGKTTVAIG